MEFIGQTIAELGEGLNAMEMSIEPGQSANIQLCSTGYLSQEEIERFYSDLITCSFHSSYPKQTIHDGFSTISFDLKRGSPQWALLIPMLPTVLTVGLIVFGIIQIGKIAAALLPLILATGGFIIIGMAIQRLPRR